MHLLKNPPFDVRTALQPVASISRAPFTLVVVKDHPAQSVSELTEVLEEEGRFRELRGRLDFGEDHDRDL